MNTWHQLYLTRCGSSTHSWQDRSSASLARLVLARPASQSPSLAPWAESSTGFRLVGWAWSPWQQVLYHYLTGGVADQSDIRGHRRTYIGRFLFDLSEYNFPNKTHIAVCLAGLFRGSKLPEWIIRYSYWMRWYLHPSIFLSFVFLLILRVSIDHSSCSDRQNDSRDSRRP